MCVRKDENKLKRGQGWPSFFKKNIITPIVRPNQRTLNVKGSIAVRLVSSLTGLDTTKQENVLLFLRG